MSRMIPVSLLVLAGSLTLLVTPPTHAADGVDSQKTESVGVVSGLLVGALLGGPPGAIISAAAGGVIGEQVAVRRHHRQLQAELAAASAQLAELETTNSRLQQQQLALQKRLYQRDLVASTSVPAPSPASEAGETVLHFRTGSSTLEPHYRDALLRFVRQSQAQPGRVVEVVGHADRVGDATFNLLLSQRRVEAVLTQLRALGLQSATYQTVAIGEQQPVSATSDAQTDFFDRRVVLRLQAPASLLSSSQP